MSLTSMTGFARHDGAYGALTWHWEVKSVNGRNLDVRCRLAPGFEALEPKLRASIAKLIRRGSCQVSLYLKREAGDAQIEVNEAALAKVVAAAEQLSGNDKLAPARIDGLLALRGVLQTADIDLAADGDDLQKALLASFDETLADLVAARSSEGGKLATIIANQIDDVERLTNDARDCPERKAEAVKQRLQEQVAKLLETSDELDEARLHQEAVLLAARADVQEELDRMYAHIEAGRVLLHDNGPMGRKLDFLVQEMNREANTLCSKANHKSLTAIGLELKGAIDQIKEQVQNIE